jgi:AraC-like DNA-binding protein
VLDRPELVDGQLGETETGSMRDELWTEADPLGNALHLLRMSGTFYFRSELTVPWGLGIPPMPDCLWFHVVTAGSALLDVDGEPARTLRPGELALVPHGTGHRLRDAADTLAPSVLGIPHEFVTDRYAIIRHGGGGPATTLVCGAVRFAHPAARSLVHLLPATIHLSEPGTGADRDSEWLPATLRMMAAEAARLRPGGETVLTRLSDVLVIQAIRAWLEADPGGRTGWLGALRDPQIGRALALVHRDPARPWTVATLAAESAMSRSAFAARFTELVGEPAMQYVTRWRMQTALQELGSGDRTVAELAGRLGYRSEAAFSRAFKRVVGIAPGAARQRAGAAPGG